MSIPPTEDTLHLEQPTTMSGSASVIGQLKRLWQSETGLGPILIGLLALMTYFTIRSPVFLSAGNITNLFIQGTIFVLLGMAEIWLLLMGDIDLSIGFSAGIGGCIAVILTSQAHRWPWWIALPLALIACTSISAFWGVLCVYLRLPSFIVTLAGQIGLAGVLLFLIDSQGNTGGALPVQERVLYDLVNANLYPVVTWIVILAAVAVLSWMILRGEQRRRSAGLEGKPVWLTLVKVAALVASGITLVLIFNTNRSTFTSLRGMPVAVPIDLGVLAIGTFILTKTRAGRYIFAIGGNVEAARRAGVSVNRYRILAFMLSGATTGVAGLLYVSRLGGISTGIEGGEYVLYAVAAAVIGGTSLFGGRGKMIHAVIGGLVIATIDNGMALINISAAGLYMVTALVLLAAVVVDSLARRSRSTGT
ncbi:MAG: ABC transporter permease [Acidobacteriota bacterium]|nr:ABC transporter permease [Acidobacteriota bacterium]